MRWVNGLTRKELAARFGKSEAAIQNYFQELRKKGFRVAGLSDQQRQEIKLAAQNVFCGHAQRAGQLAGQG